MDEEKNADLFLDLAQRLYGEEENRRELMDRKASMSIGFTSVLAGVLYFSFQNFSKIPMQLQPILSVMGLICTISLIGSFMFSVRVLFLANYVSLPNPAKLFEKYLKVENGKVKAQLIAQFTDAFNSNRVTNEKKADMLQFAMWSIIVAAGILLLSALAIAWGGS
ncbi:MAG: hypothetical protein WC483_01565 [Candidatus Paceibacterota bacterium]